MASPVLFPSTLLKENIFFLTIGTLLSSVAVLLFDNRLYTSVEVFLLFFVLFIALLIQAFAGSQKLFTSSTQAVLLYVKSLLVNLASFCILYGFLLPYTFDFLLTFKLSLLVTFIETSLSFFIRYRKQYQLNIEKEKRIGQSIKQQQVKELEVLKQQIDPHFIFNSFNTLVFLIDENSDKAKLFSTKLANVHRYIIFNSNKNLVSVADELEFARDYAYLQEIRHSNEVQISFSGFTETDNTFILPISIQILIENAIKHNAFSEKAPLTIVVQQEDGFVSVQNNIFAKSYETPSSKIGLSNLRDRCRLILGKDLLLQKTDSFFKVSIPLLLK
ncbi:MAG TPA: histidine kinase [Flavisolibacter sp.]|nr:histidine kinase [Flavisolibacter sp.]